MAQRPDDVQPEGRDPKEPNPAQQGQGVPKGGPTPEQVEGKSPPHQPSEEPTETPDQESEQSFPASDPPAW